MLDNACCRWWEKRHCEVLDQQQTDQAAAERCILPPYVACAVPDSAACVRASQACCEQAAIASTEGKAGESLLLLLYTLLQKLSKVTAN